MHALILFDRDHANDDSIDTAATCLLSAQFRVRYAALEQISPEAFENITHLIMACTPPSTLPKSVHTDMFTVAVDDVPCWSRFYAHGQDN